MRMTREEAIGRIQEHIHIHSKKEPFTPYLDEAFDMAIEALKEQIDRKWIPCSERLPEEDDLTQVIVSVNERYAVYKIILLPSRSVKTEYKLGHIDAWMPLPEPYREEENE